MFRGPLLVFLILLAFAPASHARAQSVIVVGGAQSLLLDPCVRSSGMGLSSNAVFWGECTNDWINPALLAYRSGIAYESGRTQLVPELADDIFYTSKRLTIGGYGAGILIAGKPIGGIGRDRLDYGESIVTDVDGNVLFSFDSFEETRAFAAGVNLLEASYHALHALGREIPDLSRYGDVAVGWSAKRTHVLLAPASIALGGEGSVTTHDSGILARLTPYDGIDHAGFSPKLDHTLGVRVDLSYGGSTLNYNNARIIYGDPSLSDPIVRLQAKGWSLHAAFDPPRRIKERYRSEPQGWLIDLLSPLLSVGKTGMKQVPLVPTEVGGAGERIRNSGWEVTLANIYSIRGGKVDDPAGGVRGKTKGWGIGFNLKGTAGISYDRATVPQSIFLQRPIKRKAVTFFVNPLRVWDRLHRSNHGPGGRAPDRTEPKFQNG